MFGIEGHLSKTRDDVWIIYFPSIDSMTEGDSKEEALNMGADLILTYLEYYFEDQLSENFSVEVHEGSKGQVVAVASDHRFLISLFLIKQREIASMSLRQAADSLNAKSRNAYNQYEKGKIDPSIGTLSELLEAVNPNDILCISTLSCASA